MFHRGLFACLLVVLAVAEAPAQRIMYRPPVRTFTPSPPIRPVGGVGYHPTYVSGGSSTSSDTGGSWWDRWGWGVIVGGVFGVVVLVGIVAAAKGDGPVSPAVPTSAAGPIPVAPPPQPASNTVLVRVTTMPEGEAPEWVRRAWVGLVLPAVDNRLFRGQEVLSGKRSFAPAYQVNTTLALTLLEVENQQAAADWWRQNVPDTNTPGQHFLFSPECCAPL